MSDQAKKAQVHLSEYRVVDRMGGGFMLAHTKCGMALVVTQNVGVETLIRLSREHVAKCPKPDGWPNAVDDLTPPDGSTS